MTANNDLGAYALRCVLQEVESGAATVEHVALAAEKICAGVKNGWKTFEPTGRRVLTIIYQTKPKEAPGQ